PFINNGHQFYENCYIEGRVDFIFGSATAVFLNCELHSKNGGYVTAASTPQEKPYGFVFIKCRLTGSDEPWVDPATGQPKNAPGRQADLGRPWRGYASVTFIDCEMGDHISPHGWNNWGRPENESTARYSEYGSKTPEGSEIDLEQRAPWAKILTEEETDQYSIANVLGQGWGLWDPTSVSSTSPSTTRLPARDAHIAGDNAKLENGGGNIGYWSNTNTSIQWDANLQTGKYRIGLKYALQKDYAGSELNLSVGDKTFSFTPEATAGWEDYKILSVGELEVGQPGPVTITLQATNNPTASILNVKEVIFQKQ
ncbi:MAG: pectinesterase family protein, partial [Chthoniobacterales bacterium]